jgi:hypothetical protein
MHAACWETRNLGTEEPVSIVMACPPSTIPMVRTSTHSRIETRQLSMMDIWRGGLEDD